MNYIDNVNKTQTPLPDTYNSYYYSVIIQHFRVLIYVLEYHGYIYINHKIIFIRDN